MFKKLVSSLAIAVTLIMPLASAAKVVDPPVKRSVNMICHAKGTRYYKQTLKFTTFKTLKDCIKSGGRLPK